jgi:hypothetical protein
MGIEPKSELWDTIQYLEAEKASCGHLATEFVSKGQDQGGGFGGLQPLNHANRPMK